jgi:hypothetical protein
MGHPIALLARSRARSVAPNGCVRLTDRRRNGSCDADPLDGSSFCRNAAELPAPPDRYVGVQMELEKLREQQEDLEAEIDPITCVVFVLIVFLIVPFTLLSPFRYPQPSALDKLLAVSGEQFPARGAPGKLSGQPVLDLSVAATEPAATTASVTR